MCTAANEQCNEVRDMEIDDERGLAQQQDRAGIREQQSEVEQQVG